VGKEGQGRKEGNRRLKGQGGAGGPGGGADSGSQNCEIRQSIVGLTARQVTFNPI